MAVSSKLKNLLKEWDALKNQIAPLKAQLSPLEEQERAIRKQIADCFENKVEGSKNVIELANGYALKLNYKLKYAVDEAALRSLSEELTTAEIPLDLVLKYKPEIVKGVYSKLPEDKRALLDAVITKVPESPVIELVEPKKK